MGINLGDMIVEGEQIHGDGVNIATRLEGVAEPGGSCISAIVYEQVKNRVALEYEYLGERTVKNIAEPVLVYRVLIEPLAPVGSESVLRQASPEQSRRAQHKRVRRQAQSHSGVYPQQEWGC